MNYSLVLRIDNRSGNRDVSIITLTSNRDWVETHKRDVINDPPPQGVEYRYVQIEPERLYKELKF